MGNHRAPRRASRRTEQVPVDPAFDVAPETSAGGGAAAAGKRRAVKHAGSRGSLFKALPSAPVLLGVAALAVSTGGAVTVANSGSTGASTSQTSQITAAGALGGVSAVSSNSLLAERRAAVSRDGNREAAAQQEDQNQEDQAEQLAAERSQALAQVGNKADKQAKRIELNLWTLPMKHYQLTARFGEYGLWSSMHTGLDFNGDTGDPIYAIARGTVTSAGYAGAYGNRTIITLDDGTEIWFCHQSAFDVSVGQTVSQGQLIGYVGATGHVTGSHLHVEVRPGGGDPVDPYTAFQAHGVTP